VNDSVTAVEERGVEADAHGSYETGKSKSVIITIAPGIAFIFERIHTGPLSGCSSCTIDFVAIHWYNSRNASAFKDYVVQAHEDSSYRPVWITEFQGPSSEEEEIMFLEEVLPWPDSQDYVHRYAYFMASEGSLISGRVLSRVRETFASFV
jgi:hypothetical protein